MTDVDIGPAVSQEPPALVPAELSELYGRPKTALASIPSRASRSRIDRGKPGSRKHARWLHTQLILGNLRSIMYESGEELTDGEDLEDEIEYRQSAFMKLAQQPELLDIFRKGRESVNKSAKGRRSRAIPFCPQDCDQRDVRRKFKGMRRFIAHDGYILHFLRSLETHLDVHIDKSISCAGIVSKTNRSTVLQLFENDLEVVCVDDLQKSVRQYHDLFPSCMILVGVDALLRKLVHQFVYFYGLNSSSFLLDGSSDKVVVIRRVCSNVPTKPQFSVTQSLMEWSE